MNGKEFVRCQRNGADYYASYVGQDRNTIIELLEELGATDIEFITQDEWKAGQAS